MARKLVSHINKGDPTEALPSPSGRRIDRKKGDAVVEID
jgi:hypothetical protein